MCAQSAGPVSYGTLSTSTTWSYTVQLDYHMWINIDDMQQHRQTFSPQPTIPQAGQIQYENEAFTPQSSPQTFQPQRRSLHSPLEGYYQPSPIRSPSFPPATPFSDTLQATSATEAMKGTPTNIQIGARSPSLSLSLPPPTYEN